MPHSFEPERSAAFNIPLGAQAPGESLSVKPLTDEHEREVLAYLAGAHSVQAIFMSSLIRDNGMESPFNRGVFYGCRSGAQRQLAGVGLIGHATLVETGGDASLEALARVARVSPSTHVIMGEEERIKRFWQLYSQGGQRPRVVCREMLFELREPVERNAVVKGLRLATLDDLQFVMPVQACMAFEESGIDPLEQDAVGFRLRCARRIEQGRVWVWIEAGRLIFKADILADTQRAVYLEGVYTSPEVRGSSYGSRCMSEMARALLRRTGALILLVNEQNRKAQEFYTQAGFRFKGYYDTIFLQPTRL